jgi:hypothetical protein
MGLSALPCREVTEVCGRSQSFTTEVTEATEDGTEDIINKWPHELFFI